MAIIDFNKLGLQFQKTKLESDYNILYKELELFFKKIISKSYSRNTEYTRTESIQEALVSVWENIDQYDPERGAFTSWSVQILVNALRNNARMKKHTFLIVPERHMSVDKWRYVTNQATVQNDAFGANEEEWKVNDLEPLVEKLPEYIRPLVWDKYIERMSYKEMQKKHNIPINTMKTRCRKGVAIMKGKDPKTATSAQRIKAWELRRSNL